MRLISILCLLFCLGLLAQASDAADPVTYERALFASQVGDVSALAIGEKGTLYSADAAGGRIYRLTDRAKDGRIDSKRVIAKDLSQPSGLAVIGKRVFVADAYAVWEIFPRTGERRQLASLANAKAKLGKRPLIAGPDGQSLIIGLTDMTGESGRVISVNINTGEARLLSLGDGPVEALLPAAQDKFWLGSGPYLSEVSGEAYSVSGGFQVAPEASISGIALAYTPETFPPSLRPFSEHIFMSVNVPTRLGRKARRSSTGLYAVPTKFGLPMGKPIEILGGVASSRAHISQVPSGEIVMDSRGIFMADAGNRSIWRIIQSPPKPKPKDKPEPKKAVVLDAPPPLDLKGSGISKASLLEKGTSIEVGSTIPEDDDENSVDSDKTPE